MYFFWRIYTGLKSVWSMLSGEARLCCSRGKNPGWLKARNIYFWTQTHPQGFFSSMCSPGWQKRSLPTTLYSLGQSLGRQGRTREPTARKCFGLNVTPLASRGHCPGLITCNSQSIMILSYVQRSLEVVIGGLYHNI